MILGPFPKRIRKIYKSAIVALLAENMGEKTSRRKFLGTIGAGVVGLIIGGVVGWLAKPEVVAEKTVTATVTKTAEVTKTVTTTVTAMPTPVTTTPAPTGLDPVAQRAVDGVKDLIASGKVKPGTTIRLLHAGGSRENWERAIELWKRYVPEINVELVTVDIIDVRVKAMGEAVAKTGEIDGFNVMSTWIGDLVEAGAIRPIDEWFNKYDPGYTGPDAPIEPLGTYCTMYKGKRYTLITDTDVFTLSYRKDLLSDPTYKKDFEAQYGFELKIPDTWEETIKIGEFFTNLNLTTPRGEKVYGLYFYMEPSFAGYITWWNIFTESGGILFDPETMDPKIDTPEGKYALDVCLRMLPYMPPESITAPWPDLYDKFVKGQTVLTAGWPSLSKEAGRPEAPVKGKYGSALMPGVEVEVGGQKKIIKAAPNPVNWVGTISAYSKNPELMYLFYQFTTSPDIGLDMVLRGIILDLYRRSWFIDPKYRPRSAELYGEEFLDVYMKSIEVSWPDLMIRGGPEYLDKLTKMLNACYAGAYDPERVLSDIAAEWDSITKRYGLDSQLEAWRAMIQLYPEHIKELWRTKGYMK